MIDLKLIIILLASIFFIIIFGYDKKVNQSPKVLYFLIPLSLFAVYIYDKYQKIFIKPNHIKILYLIVTFVYIYATYFYFKTIKNYYVNQVYLVSICIIWCIILVFIFVYLNDKLIFDKICVFELVLYLGLLISLNLLKKNYFI